MPLEKYIRNFKFVVFGFYFFYQQQICYCHLKKETEITKQIKNGIQSWTRIPSMAPMSVVSASTTPIRDNPKSVNFLNFVRNNNNNNKIVNNIEKNGKAENTLMCPNRSMSRLSGFTSRCTMSNECTYLLTIEIRK